MRGISGYVKGSGYSIAHRILLFSFLTLVFIYYLIIASGHLVHYVQTKVCGISEETDIKSAEDCKIRPFACHRKETSMKPEKRTVSFPGIHRPFPQIKTLFSSM